MEGILGFGGDGGFGFFPSCFISLHSLAVEIISPDNLVKSSFPLLFSSLVCCGKSPQGVQPSCPLSQLLQNFTFPSPLDLEQHLAKCDDLVERSRYPAGENGFPNTPAVSFQSGPGLFTSS